MSLAEIVAREIFDSVARMEALQKLTGNELADAILENDWAEVDIFSPQSDFWECVIEKLRPADQRLAACQEAYEWLDHHGGDPAEDDGLATLLALLSRAVAKATGETPDANNTA